MDIAILGATSHIAKGLIYRFLERGGARLHLFARSGDKLQQFLASLPKPEGEYLVHTDYLAFLDLFYDVIINCVGVETRNSHDCDFTRYFTVTEEFDNLSLRYLKECNPEALYISFSSGAVYGRGFSEPAGEFSANCISVNQTAPQDYYGIVRINAEAKHRAHQQLNIVDLRVFAYFSRYITLSDGYFITDLLEAVLQEKVLLTDQNNIVRDYLHPDDLFDAVNCCIRAGKINAVIDVNSLGPVSKQEILDHFSSHHGLRYEFRERSQNSPATGAKSNYYSIFNGASGIGYVPRFTSMETLIDESQHIFAAR